MKNLIYLPVCLFYILISCNDDDMVVGSGRMVTETRSVENFSKVKSEGVFEVTITQGPVQSLEITADDNVIGRVETKVIDNELRLFLKNDGYNRVTLKARITVPHLNGLKNSGTGNIAVQEMVGNGHFNVENSGTGDIKIAGSAESLSIYNEGTGSFHGFAFMVKNADVETMGTGDIEVHCSENLTVEIEGSSNVYYKGNPTVQVDIHGSGSLINAN
ncbi:head GIN domain-containing protein [Aequorivita sp. SDUM287046]|uniref:Head GIN domain-containing protein n=1 Tax=Aequorivita aurantiaca TaxID=3053356 RepID=A0ABT8DIQ2_9FLAO|nr:head GIN domain-containing protein [Aequorivita aurantiaca]MDN3724664.1 head GIN domain-containing protein [Aequorivita aurantiaca]